MHRIARWAQGKRSEAIAGADVLLTRISAVDAFIFQPILRLCRKSDSNLKMWLMGVSQKGRQQHTAAEAVAARGNSALPSRKI